MSHVKEDSGSKKEQYLQKQLARLREAVSKVQSEQTDTKTRDAAFKDRQQRLYGKMVLFTFLLVICSAAAGGISIWQSRINSRLANITAGQLTISTEQVHVGQRAYVIPKQLALSEPLRAGYPVKFSFVVRNSGQTPARELHVGPMLKVFDHRLKGPTLNGQSSPSAPFSVTFLGAGDELRPTEGWLDDDRNRLLDDREFREIMNGTKYLYALGLIQYVDVFHQQDETTFCSVYSPEHGALINCESGSNLK